MAHVLIIADMNADAVLAEAACQAAAHTTVMARHGLPALECLTNDAFDLIVIDLDGSRERARTLLHAIRTNRLHGRTPVVGLLGCADYDALGGFVAGGISAALLKPCRMRTLHEAVAEGLGVRSREGSRGGF